MCLASDPRLTLGAIAVALVVAAAGSVCDKRAGDDGARLAPSPVVGRLILFGGGRPLQDASSKLLGAVGVWSETSAGHAIAWKIGHRLGLEAVGPPWPAGGGRANTKDSPLAERASLVSSAR
jgi:hypothetical protein